MDKYFQSLQNVYRDSTPQRKIVMNSMKCSKKVGKILIVMKETDDHLRRSMKETDCNP